MHSLQFVQLRLVLCQLRHEHGLSVFARQTLKYILLQYLVALLLYLTFEGVEPTTNELGHLHEIRLLARQRADHLSNVVVLAQIELSLRVLVLYLVLIDVVVVAIVEGEDGRLGLLVRALLRVGRVHNDPLLHQLGIVQAVKLDGTLAIE